MIKKIPKRRTVSSDSEKHSLSDDDNTNEDYNTPDNQSSNEYVSGFVTFLKIQTNYVIDYT